MVDARTRRIQSKLAKLLFNSNDIRDAKIFFPAHVIVRAASWAHRKNFKNGLTSASYIGCPVKWATVTFTTPVAAGSEGEKIENQSADGRERSIMKKIRKAESEEDMSSPSRAPPQYKVDLMNKLLLFLERRCNLV